MKREIMLSAAESVAVELAFDKHESLAAQLEQKKMATIRMAIADTLSAKGLIITPETRMGFNPIGPGKTILVFDDGKPDEKGKPEAPKAEAAPVEEAPAPSCTPCESGA